MENKVSNLAEAIRLVVSTFSKSLLLESRVVNILTDYNAFKEVVPSKFILKSIISEGYVDKLLLCQKWDDSCDKLAEKFIAKTGLQPNYVNYVFASLSYGLGWTKKVPKLEEEEKEAVKTHKASASTAPPVPTKATKQKKHKKCENMTDDEFEQYICSKIDWNHDLEQKAGLTFSNFQITQFNFYTGFRILFEVRGKIHTNHLALEYTAYDNKGRLRESSTGFYQTKEDRPKKTGELNVFFNQPLDILDKVTISATYDF